MAFFDAPEPDDVEKDYIERNVPPEALELWNDSISASPVWDSMSPEEHMQASDLYSDAVFQGSFFIAEEFLALLQIDWDDSDVREFYDAYEALVH